MNELLFAVAESGVILVVQQHDLDAVRKHGHVHLTASLYFQHTSEIREQTVYVATCDDSLTVLRTYGITSPI